MQFLSSRKIRRIAIIFSLKIILIFPEKCRFQVASSPVNSWKNSTWQNFCDSDSVLSSCLKGHTRQQDHRSILTSRRALHTKDGKKGRLKLKNRLRQTQGSHLSVVVATLKWEPHKCITKKAALRRKMISWQQENKCGTEKNLLVISWGHKMRNIYQRDLWR